MSPKPKGVIFFFLRELVWQGWHWPAQGLSCAVFLQQDAQYPPLTWWQSQWEVLGRLQCIFGKQEPRLVDASPLSGDRLARLAGGELGLSLSAGSYLFLLPLSAACNGMETTELSSHFPLWRKTFPGMCCPDPADTFPNKLHTPVPAIPKSTSFPSTRSQQRHPLHWG